MTKYFCDRCGKECSKLSDVKIPHEKNSFSFSTKTFQMCSDCEEKANNINDKLTDIRFLLFRDFMKGGGE
jgi:DNA-directed RNA polymerase subunit RPC12/RpoP